jgi:peptidoglycan hydrolase-like protein with peptidoglycan-binding domain
MWDRGADVTALQEFLINHGIGPAAAKLKIHGTTPIFGILTYYAVVEFQKKAGIVPASGFFGPITRAYVNGLK